MLKTLKVAKYRGSNLYIRHVVGRQYEVLVSYRGQIHQHGLIIQKEGKKEHHKSVKEQEESAIDQGLRCAIQMLDNFKEERKVVNIIKRKLITLYEQISQGIRQYARVSEVEEERGEGSSGSAGLVHKPELQGERREQ